MAMSATAKGIRSNKVAAHWVQKLQNRKSRRFAFLDSGATSGAAPEEDPPDLDNTGQPSQKTFMFPDGRTGKATKKMLLKHNLRLAAWEMNIVPGLHSALVSIPKLADAGYITVFKKWRSYLQRQNNNGYGHKSPHPGIRTLRTHRNVDTKPQSRDNHLQPRSPNSTTRDTQHHL